MNYIDRIEIEADELRKKSVKLYKFFSSNKRQAVSDEAMDLLYQQHAIMTEYLDILEERIDLAKGK